MIYFNYNLINNLMLFYIKLRQIIYNFFYYDYDYDYISLKLIKKDENNNLVYNISLNDLINIKIEKNNYLYLEKKQNNKLIKYCNNLNGLDINNIYNNFKNFSLDNNCLKNQVLEVDLNENKTISINKYFNEFIFKSQIVKNIYLSEYNLFIDQLCNNNIKITDTWLNEYIIKKPYNSQLILNNF